MELARFMKENVKNELKRCYEEALQYLRTGSETKLALVIDGKCLMYALDPSLRVMLLNLSLNCNAVVCCRVSPLQKAQVMFLRLLLKSISSETIDIIYEANTLTFLLFLSVKDVARSIYYCLRYWCC